jgi:hypothetical protein
MTTSEALSLQAADAARALRESMEGGVLLPGDRPVCGGAVVEVVAAGEPDDADPARHERRADDVSEQLRLYALSGGYPNLLPGRERGRTQLAYGQNLIRLLEIQRRLDPDDVFSSAPGSVIAG